MVTCYSDNRSNSRANTCNKPRLPEGMHLLDKRLTRAMPVAQMIHDNLVECFGPTGVEMEALTAVSGAALTVVDMCKAIDRQMSIKSAYVAYKSGGRSGVFIRRGWYNDGGKPFLEEKGLVGYDRSMKDAFGWHVKQRTELHDTLL